MFIILCETAGCLSQQPQGICWTTWSPRCAVCTVHLYIIHCRCI